MVFTRSQIKKIDKNGENLIRWLEPQSDDEIEAYLVTGFSKISRDERIHCVVYMSSKRSTRFFRAFYNALPAEDEKKEVRGYVADCDILLNSPYDLPNYDPNKQRFSEYLSIVEERLRA